MVLIAIGGILAKRFFGSKRADADDDVQGDHEVTRFVFGAANAGDYTDQDKIVDESFVAYFNGYRMGIEEDQAGPEMLTQGLHYYDEHVEDSFWELYDEVADVSHGAGKIALRFVASGVFAGDPKQVEVAGFLKIADNKLTEMRLLGDVAAFNEMRTAAGLPPLK